MGDDIEGEVDGASAALSAGGGLVVIGRSLSQERELCVGGAHVEGLEGCGVGLDVSAGQAGRRDAADPGGFRELRRGSQVRRGAGVERVELGELGRDLTHEDKAPAHSERAESIRSRRAREVHRREERRERRVVGGEEELALLGVEHGDDAVVRRGAATSERSRGQRFERGDADSAEPERERDALGGSDADANACEGARADVARDGLERRAIEAGGEEGLVNGREEALRMAVEIAIRCGGEQAVSVDDGGAAARR